jgi:hypothetical protein
MGTFRQPTKAVSDVATYVKRSFGDESGVQVTDSDIIRWINAAVSEIVSTNSVLKGTATRDTEAGVYQYSLGDSIDIQYISSIHVNGYKLRAMSFQDAETYITNSDPSHSSTGNPQLWYEWGGVVHVYPTPDNAYSLSVYYTKVPTPVLELTDTLPLPDSYFSRIVEFCMAEAYELDENLQGQQLKRDQFDSRLVAMTGDEDRGADDVYPMMTVMPEDM